MPISASSKTKEALLRQLWQYGDAPRVQLAKTLGITKAAVTQLTAELVEQGVLVEKGELVDAAGKQPRGRRKILLGINENYKLSAGLTLTPEGLSAGLCNLKGGILSRLFLPLKEETHHGTLELMSQALLILQKENCIQAQRLLGAGVTIYGDCPFIEGGVPSEQGKRLARELAHGVGLKLVYSPISAGAILVERLFSGASQNPESSLIIMLSENRRPETAVFANGGIFPGKHSGAGGSRLISAAPTTPEEGKELAAVFASSVQAIDPARLITYIHLPTMSEAGESFSAELSRLIPRDIQVAVSALTADTLFLSPAAAAVDRLLFL